MIRILRYAAVLAVVMSATAGWSGCAMQAQTHAGQSFMIDRPAAAHRSLVLGSGVEGSWGPESGRRDFLLNPQPAQSPWSLEAVSVSRRDRQGTVNGRPRTHTHQTTRSWQRSYRH